MGHGDYRDGRRPGSSDAQLTPLARTEPPRSSSESESRSRTGREGLARLTGVPMPAVGHRPAGGDGIRLGAYDRSRPVDPKPSRATIERAIAGQIDVRLSITHDPQWGRHVTRKIIDEIAQRVVEQADPGYSGPAKREWYLLDGPIGPWLRPVPGTTGPMGSRIAAIAWIVVGLVSGAHPAVKIGVEHLLHAELHRAVAKGVSSVLQQVVFPSQPPDEPTTLRPAPPRTGPRMPAASRAPRPWRG